MQRLSILALALIASASLVSTAAAQSRITLSESKDRVRVEIDGELFTEYIYEGYEKPILYPIIGPKGHGLTRNYPMVKGVAHEAEDHPHHKSIWFGHMRVNGSSFWHSGETAGTTQSTEVRIQDGAIYSENSLVDTEGQQVATDSRVISFEATPEMRIIDYRVTYHANVSDLVFGDDKDGQMGIRMHPNLRIKGEVAQGQAVNSRGVRAKDIWGKRAEWIDYWGPIEGSVVGIAVFDHPENLRHPTWWHARDYGLLSANPFGIHHFEEKKDHALGEYKLAQGESLTFRHRFLFHLGSAEEADIQSQYERWIEQ